MTTCIPIKELKNTSKLSQLVKNSPEPVIVTRNGCETFAVMTIEQLDALRLEAARSKLYQVIDQAELDIANGDIVDARVSQREARQRYGL